MKPTLIGRIDNFQHPQRNWEEMVEVGQVESYRASLEEWDFPALAALAKAAGYTPMAYRRRMRRKRCLSCQQRQQHLRIARVDYKAWCA